MNRHLSATTDNALASQLELAFEDNRLAAQLYGDFDQNLALIEQRLSVTATPRGANEVLLHYSSVFGIPTYVRGVLTEVMETLALAQFSVTFTTQPDGTTDYLVTWTK